MTSNKYKLIRLKSKDYGYASLSTDFARPDEYLDCLTEELTSLNFQGKIVFDLLLCNGMTNQRFFSAYFDGNKFINTSFAVVEDLTKTIRIETTHFYTQNYELICSNHILNKAQKFLVKRGIVK